MTTRTDYNEMNPESPLLVKAAEIAMSFDGRECRDPELSICVRCIRGCDGLNILVGVSPTGAPTESLNRVDCVDMDVSKHFDRPGYEVRAGQHSTHFNEREGATIAENLASWADVVRAAGEIASEIDELLMEAAVS